ncbi:MAG TPA: class I SAM-dependent methyltransferase [Stellaceae bacterium]|nr:class I SAM-dependent methyltransferase [Stellaceae bacterium]
MKTAEEGYSDEFYRSLDETSEVSARAILPLLFELAPVESVVDVGCGDGAWLAVALDCGAGEILGLEGPWIEEARLKIPSARLRRVRLDRPFGIERRFDLAMSLEVAEHLPPDRAAGFVEELTRLAPLVLFSAAVPGQGGVHHLNEQWPFYWARLFAEHGYRAIDALRLRVWDAPAVAFWYKQNVLIFAAPNALAAHPKLAAAAAASSGDPAALVHPDLYCQTLRLAEPGFRRWLEMAPQAVRRSLARRAQEG